MPRYKNDISPKQELFVKEYLVDLNASAAYLRAGYKTGNPDVNGPRLLGRAGIQRRVSDAMAERGKRVEITSERVLAELGKIAFSDVRQMFNDDGALVPIKELSDQAAACIAGCDIVTISRDDGNSERVAKIKLADKLRALELCGKHLGLFKEDRSGEFAPLPWSD